MKKHAAPIIAAIVLLLPMLYVGSYLAMVMPGRIKMRSNGQITAEDYRYGPEVCGLIFWPLEQIDRKLRPRAWRPHDPSHHIG